MAKKSRRAKQTPAETLRHKKAAMRKSAGRTHGGRGKEGWPEITTANMDAILRFLPLLEDDGFKPGQMVWKRGEMPFYNLSADATALEQALCANGWIVPFPWVDWKEGRRYFDDPTALAEADMQTLRRLFTTIVRQDRFCEGFMGSMLETGFITALLRRLKEIREALP